MKSKEEKDVVFGTFTWKIDNFSKLNYIECSEEFVIDGFKWFIISHPKDKSSKHEENFGLVLSAVDSLTLAPGWTRYAHFSLAVVNQLDTKNSIKKETSHLCKFKEWDIAWSCSSLMPRSMLFDPAAGYVVNDTCVIEAKIAVHKEVSKTQKTHTKPTGELKDFRGLGRVEEAFIPFLEEVCSWHPSLIECQRNRSGMFTECAFRALGRVLYFLKTTKVKDMNKDAYRHLQLIWEELETFKFDLAWLKPCVHTAFGMNKFVESTRRVRKLRQRLDALVIKTERQRAKLAAAEAQLEIARRGMVKVEGCNEVDMDSELGYGRPQVF